MKPVQFFNLVRKMRNLQKEYFKTRDFRTLAAAKQFEESVDDEIFRLECLGYTAEKLEKLSK